MNIQEFGLRFDIGMIGPARKIHGEASLLQRFQQGPRTRDEILFRSSVSGPQIFDAVLDVRRQSRSRYILL